MKKARNAWLAVLLLATVLVLSACGTPTPSPAPAPGPTPTPDGPSDPFAACESVAADTERAQASFGELKIRSSVQNGITESNGVYTIRKGGDYEISGMLYDGAIRVEVGKEEKVKLILMQAYISSATHAPITLVSADELTVKAEGNTYNVLHDRRPSSAILEADAAVYSKDDLTFSGRGVLVLRSDNGMGAHSSNDIHIKNVSLKIDAYDTALKGNDSVTVESGTLCLISRAEDGIKTSNTDLSSKGKQRGSVTVQGGRVDVFSAGDGIQAAFSYLQMDGTVTVRTGRYATYPHTVNGTFSDATASKGIKCEHELTVKDGTLWVMAEEAALKANGGTVTESGMTGKGTVHLSGGYVFAGSGDFAVCADGNFTVSSAYFVMEALSDEGLTDVHGTVTYMTSNVLFLGHADAFPTEAVSLDHLSMSADTYTVLNGESTPFVFTAHTAHTSLGLLCASPLPDGTYTVKSKSDTVCTFQIVNGVHAE